MGRKFRRPSNRIVGGMIIVAVIVAAGLYAVISSHAAGAFVIDDICEDATVSGDAFIGHDHVNASCGHYVSFGFQPPTNVSTSLVKAAEGVIGAVDIANTGIAGDKRIFIVTQGGKIYLSNADGANASGNLFLDISDRVHSGGEQGLLGLAFDPDYATNGYFYVNYTTNASRGTYNGQMLADGDTVVSRFSRTSASTADPNSEFIIFGADQPEANHNGGGLKFGKDGYMYISLGDGGGAGDNHTVNCSYGNAQCLNSYLGKILRIDVAGATATQRYKVPAGNPFIGQSGAKPEIWVYGLRNPWRFTWDDMTDDMFIGDVGQNAWEEIDFLPAGQKGKNFGWRCYEGTHQYNFNGNTACNTPSNFVMPIYEYDRSGGGCSVIAGYIYRGTAHPEFGGTYVFSDYCHSKLLYLNKKQDGSWGLTKTVDTGFPQTSVTSFGVDTASEIYVAVISGVIYRLDVSH